MEEKIKKLIQELEVKKHKAALHSRPQEYTAINQIVKSLKALFNDIQQTNLFP